MAWGEEIVCNFLFYSPKLLQCWLLCCGDSSISLLSFLHSQAEYALFLQARWREILRDWKKKVILEMSKHFNSFWVTWKISALSKWKCLFCVHCKTMKCCFTSAQGSKNYEMAVTERVLKKRNGLFHVIWKSHRVYGEMQRGVKSVV